MSKELVPVPFHEDKIFLIDVEGKPFVVLHLALKNIGLDAWAQIEKLRNRSWAVTRQEAVTDSNNHTRPTWVCDVRTFLMLLATIDEDRVAIDVRPKLIAYQAEVADVIESYWTGEYSTNKPLSISDVALSFPAPYKAIYSQQIRLIIRTNWGFEGDFYNYLYENGLLPKGTMDFIKKNLTRRYLWFKYRWVERKNPTKEIMLHQYLTKHGKQLNELALGVLVGLMLENGKDKKAIKSKFESAKPQLAIGS